MPPGVGMWPKDCASLFFWNLSPVPTGLVGVLEVPQERGVSESIYKTLGPDLGNFKVNLKGKIYSGFSRFLSHNSFGLWAQ